MDLTQNYFLSPNILASIELRKMVELDGAKDGNIFGIWIKRCFYGGFFFFGVCVEEERTVVDGGGTGREEKYEIFGSEIKEEFVSWGY